MGMLLLLICDALVTTMIANATALLFYPFGAPAVHGMGHLQCYARSVSETSG